MLMYVEFSKPYLLRARSALKKRKKKMRSTLELYNESASLFSSFFFRSTLALYFERKKRSTLGVV